MTEERHRGSAETEERHRRGAETETVVVTGGAGFIGRWVVAELLRRDHEVRVIDDLSTGTLETISEFRDDDRFELYRRDVGVANDVSSVFEDADACIHLAARIDVQGSLERPREHVETNVDGTVNVLEACRRSDTRLAVVGTCMVYEPAPEEGGIDETHPVKPASPYAGTKLAAEDIALSYYEAYGLPVTVLRPFNTYGPFQESGGPIGVIVTYLLRDIRNETIEIYGDGTQTRDFLYATDCARFLVDGTFESDAVGEIINAGSDRDVSIVELANTIGTEGTEIEHVEHHHPESDLHRLRCDSGKAERLLDWRPEVSLEEGIQQTRDWLLSKRDEGSAT